LTEKEAVSQGLEVRVLQAPITPLTVASGKNHRPNDGLEGYDRKAVYFPRKNGHRVSVLFSV